ncbi:hypothetical protein LCGC14_2201590 [marine sediment metagenome]|uniref:Uncharacterized protein n=1 Tax=marine sediment metagenome TaxID=412755 RepID=A0A0F9E3U6_9ZZZZ
MDIKKKVADSLIQYKDGHCPPDISEAKCADFKSCCSVCWSESLIPLVRADMQREIANLMAEERCDPDVMPYFEDYCWLPRDVWRALRLGMFKSGTFKANPTSEVEE